LTAHADAGAHALLTTPGAGKWYRSAGAYASQDLRFRVEGTLEWLPRETIVYEGALARLGTEIDLGASGAYVGWEILCLGRAEGFARGTVRLSTRVRRE